MSPENIAFLFPGQGSQYVGMGQDLFESSLKARQLLQEAERITGLPLTEVMFHGPEELLRQTIFAQPAIFVTSVAALMFLEEGGLRGEACCGHSLGEYSALVSAGLLDFPSAMSLVSHRARLMQEICEKLSGTMAAILGLEPSQIEDVCQRVAHEQPQETVEMANLNSPDQIVISGTKGAVERACQEALKEGAKKALPLPVAGPFHSSLMKPVSEGLAQEVEKAPFGECKVSFLPNIKAMPADEIEEIKNGLIEQVYSPVLWWPTMEWLLKRGYNNFVEVGPGKVLKGLMKKISKEAQVYNACDLKSIDETIEAIKGKF